VSSESSTEPVGRHKANLISIAIFLVSLAAFLIILLPHSTKLPSTTKTTVSTIQVVQGTRGVTQRTQTTQTTTNEADPPFWLSILGRQQTAFLIIAISILAAYCLAAIAQRVLLGKYAITIGPFSVPEVTSEQVEDAIKPALPDAAESLIFNTIDFSNEEPTARSDIEMIVVPTEPTWTTIGDPNLALAGWRIDVERELKRLSTQSDVPASTQRIPRKMVSTLAERGVITNAVANSLQDMLTIANRGVHGAKVDTGVLEIIRTDGLTILNYLKSLGDPLIPGE
jgi:hypothetical protein